ncbi:hypothetical protein CHS0354_013656 [Potamilus streckersoni]|uniref:FYVE-type domain-containing protein n=1 Tax=Potamilus streckersoni TaxID=2493646 RepID=A0AAE0VH22_9BIVA|nr:hypothetical protein CHS0354_013656 [Potamilus streckersoni]
MIEYVHVNWNPEADGQRGSWQNSACEISLPEGVYDGQLEQKDITKKHWKNSDSRPNCFIKSCRQKFSLIERPHHCRRCGEVFCSTCLKYQRKLNVLANPDPEGKPYKVCRTCFEEGRDSQGCVRSLSEEFKALKRSAKGQQLRQEYANTTSSWRDKLDIKQECQRLLMGFQKSIGTSEVMRTLQELRTVIATPDWQKSSLWMQENMSEVCQSCRTKFSLLKKKRHCKVCGVVLCKSCSYEELLIYLPDERDPEEITPQLGVIKFIGCPVVEPEICLLLHICCLCKEKLVDIQLSAVELSSKSKGASEFISKLLTVDGTTSDLQNKIVDQLKKYQEIIESLEDNTTRASSVIDEKGKHISNTKVLAKAQEDLSDYLAQYVLKVKLAKRLQPEAISDTQKILMKNYLRAKSEFYLDNIYTFRKMKAKLGDSAPAEVLDFIQRTVDRHAIVSSELYIRQLAFETIHMCDKYKLEESIPRLLTPVDEAIEGEAKACLLNDKEDWDLHLQHLHQMIQAQIKDHRLIRTSRRYLAQSGAMHAAEIMFRRSREILEQVHIQLAMKSANRSFPASKKALIEACEKAAKLDVKDVIKS